MSEIICMNSVLVFFISLSMRAGAHDDVTMYFRFLVSADAAAL